MEYEGNADESILCVPGMVGLSWKVWVAGTEESSSPKHCYQNSDRVDRIVVIAFNRIVVIA